MEWVQIEEFPRYYVNANGQVLDSERDMVIHPNKVTGGALAVHMKADDGQFYMRSLKVLVARAFVPFDFDPEIRDITLFDTPIVLDNNQDHLFASNIRWRPRWFAWKYSRQFRDIPQEYHRGPMKCFQNELFFDDVIHVGINYGLLFEQIYLAAIAFEQGIRYKGQYSWHDMENQPLYVWPIKKSFGFID